MRKIQKELMRSLLNKTLLILIDKKLANKKLLLVNLKIRPDRVQPGIKNYQLLCRNYGLNLYGRNCEMLLEP
jgi:hypothetical protein